MTHLRRNRPRLLFHARPTDGVVDALTGQAHTMARAGDGYSLGSNGVYTRSPHVWPRYDVDANGVPALLLEASQENLLLQSSNVTTTDGTWVNISHWSTIAARTSVIPGATAYLHTNGGGGSSRNRTQTIGTLTASPETVYAIVENVDASEVRVALFDATAGGEVVQARLVWATGVVSIPSSVQGSSATAGKVSLGTGPSGGEMVLLWGSATPNNSGNSRQVIVYPTGTTTNTDTAIVHHLQHVEAAYLTSPIVTAGASVTRAAESLYYDWNVAATKAWSAYVKFVAPPAGSPALLRIGGSAPDVLADISAGEIRVVHDNNSSTVSSTTSGVSMSQGDVVEARVRFGSDGKVTAAASVNSGTEVVGTQSSALSIASWGSARLYPGGLAAEMNRVEVREIKVHPDPDATLAQLRSA